MTGWQAPSEEKRPCRRVLTEIDVERYARDGYLTAPSVLSPEELAMLREESDRVLALCAQEPERYARRIQWEIDHLATDDQRGMDRVIRKLEPVSDLSPAFARYARHPGIVDPLRQIFNDDVALFEDKLNLKLPGGSAYPWHQDWACCWRAHTDELITCFIYLDDADETMGCLQVVPGSHLGKPICPFKPGSSFEIDPSCVRHGQGRSRAAEGGRDDLLRSLPAALLRSEPQHEAAADDHLHLQSGAARRDQRGSLPA